MLAEPKRYLIVKKVVPGEDEIGEDKQYIGLVVVKGNMITGVCEEGLTEIANPYE